jgi:hypothetical protein
MMPNGRAIGSFHRSLFGTSPADQFETSEDGRRRIRQGVAPDRRFSVEDAGMRHGRTSRWKSFDGYENLEGIQRLIREAA